MCANLRIVVNMRIMVWVVLSTGTTNPRSRRRRLRLGRPRRLHGLGVVCPFCFTFTGLEKKLFIGRHWISHGLCGRFFVTYQARQCYCLDWPLFHKWVSHPLPILASEWALMWTVEKIQGSRVLGSLHFSSKPLVAGIWNRKIESTESLEESNGHSPRFKSLYFQNSIEFFSSEGERWPLVSDRQHCQLWLGMGECWFGSFWK